MDIVEKSISKFLLEIQAIKLSPEKPFKWASGWNSPIYCDNRKTLSFPHIRTFIKEQFVSLIRSQFNDIEVIAGVATGAIAQGALVADEMNLPFVYIRQSSKSHGLENLIEGVIHPSQKVVVIEDLISTGGSSLAAVEALRNYGADVLGLVAIFTYGFNTSIENFRKANCRFYSLANYNSLIETAIETNYISKNKLDFLNAWKENPDKWPNFL
jgi:orotate phosphoribosyltransferase